MVNIRRGSTAGCWILKSRDELGDTSPAVVSVKKYLCDIS
jgi:hypothetical protein